MAEERIDSFLNLLALDKEAKAFEGIIAAVEAKLASLKAAKVNVNLATNTGDIIKGIKDAQAALTGFIITVQSLVASLTAIPHNPIPPIPLPAIPPLPPTPK